MFDSCCLRLSVKDGSETTSPRYRFFSFSSVTLEAGPNQPARAGVANRWNQKVPKVKKRRTWMPNTKLFLPGIASKWAADIKKTKAVSVDKTLDFHDRRRQSRRPQYEHLVSGRLSRTRLIVWPQTGQHGWCSCMVFRVANSDGDWYGLLFNVYASRDLPCLTSSLNES